MFNWKVGKSVDDVFCVQRGGVVMGGEESLVNSIFVNVVEGYLKLLNSFCKHSKYLSSYSLILFARSPSEADR